MGNGPLFTLCPTDMYEEGAFDELYEVEEHKSIGTGKFSTVHLCWRRNAPEEKYALKMIQCHDDVSTISRVKEEIEILKLLGNHSGIITLIDVDESMSNCIRIVMELCEGGELYDAIQAKRCYAEHDAKATITVLMEAVAYIHSKGIMHRDLKPENILLSSKQRYTDVKISDFGLAKISRDYPRTLPRSRSICGSDFYLAPEVIKQEEYGREIDIWAVGVITYVLLSGSLPFFHQVLHKLYRQIVERDVSFPEEAWRNVSKGALDFILRLLQVNAGDRLTADQCLGHPWLRGQASNSSFGNSFQEYANFTRSNSNAFRQNSGHSGGNNDLQKVLSKSTSNAHPLEHANKVDTPNGSTQTTSSSTKPRGGNMFNNLATTRPGMGPMMQPGLPGAMGSKPPPNFMGGGLQVQSRASQPLRYR